MSSEPTVPPSDRTPEPGAQARPTAGAAGAGDGPATGGGTHGAGASSAFAAGQRVGPYHLLERLGEGGFGVVWLAERREPMVQRVALKIIKPGMDSAAVIARFEQERQALAVMDHPNVAKVFDGGVSDRGLPYFVMEHVQGEPITAFCDRHRYTIRQRLELFIPVCEAVQHAHQKAIIHRDLKPSNVLVEVIDGKPLVKVIDFGIAKAVGGGNAETAETMFTHAGQLIGTPEYMSPEQAAGTDNIDTRTDVYSLGVMLYELLVGRLPVDSSILRQRGYDEIRRVIREQDTPRPSTRLGEASEAEALEITARRATTTALLVRTLRRELEWIPLKAMRKERERRYASAAAVAVDIGNFLHSRPLEAVPESRLYLLRKFVSRRRALVAAGSVIATSLIAATVGIAIFAIRAERRREVAEQRLLQIENIAQFQQSVFVGITPERVGRALTHAMLTEVRASSVRRGLPDEEASRAVEDLQRLLALLDMPGVATATLDQSVLSQMERQARHSFVDDPVVLGSLLQGLASTYQSLADRDKAYALQTEALATRRASLGDRHPETIRAMIIAARMRRISGDYAACRAHAEEAFTLAVDVLGPDHPEALESMHWLGLSLIGSDPVRCKALLTESLRRRRLVLGDHNEATIWSMLALVQYFQVHDQLADCEELVQEAVARSAAALGREHETTMYALRYLRRQYAGTDRLSQAIELCRELVAQRDALLGQLHPSSISELGSLVRLLQTHREFTAALPLAEELLRRSLQRFGPDHQITVQARQLLQVLEAGSRR